MPDMKMVETEDNREDRKAQAFRQRPNRHARRNIAKKRGIFKHPGLWGHINTRSNNNQGGQ